MPNLQNFFPSYLYNLSLMLQWIKFSASIMGQTWNSKPMLMLWVQSALTFSRTLLLKLFYFYDPIYNNFLPPQVQLSLLHYKNNFPQILCFERLMKLLLPFLQLFFSINLSSIYFSVNHSDDTDLIRFNSFHNVKSCEYFSLGIVLISASLFFL